MKRKNKIIVIIVIITLICLLIFTIRYLEKKEKQLERENAKKGETYAYYEGKTFPSGIYKLKYVYTSAGGTINQELYYEQLYSFCNYIPKLYDFVQDKTDEELEEYYNNEKLNIKLNTGIMEEENFYNIAYNLKKISISNNTLGEYKCSSIDTNNIEVKDNVCVFDTKICYTNYEEGIIFKTYFNINNQATYKIGNIYFGF